MQQPAPQSFTWSFGDGKQALAWVDQDTGERGLRVWSRTWSFDFHYRTDDLTSGLREQLMEVFGMFDFDANEIIHMLRSGQKPEREPD